jgi:hypothetical protein
MRSMIVLAWLMTFPVASYAVTLSPGDLLYTKGAALVRWDPNTGNRTVVSGCPNPISPTCTAEELIGVGPMFKHTTELDPHVQPDGSIVMVGQLDDGAVPSKTALFRIDPASGDRSVIVSDDNDGVPPSDGMFPYELQNETTRVPSTPDYVAALPPWGIPLIAGIVLGLSLRLRRRD